MITVECNRTFSLIDFLEEKYPVNPATALLKISSIIIVGGLLERDQNFDEVSVSARDENALSAIDRTRLLRFLVDIMKMGICLQDVEIKLNNIIYGDDYIADQPEADMVVLSWVNKDDNGVENGRSFMPESALLKGNKASWQQALARGKSQLICVDGDVNTNCVSVSDIPFGYSQIGKTTQYGSIHARTIC